MSDNLEGLFDNPEKPGLKELQLLNEGKDDAFVNFYRDDANHSTLKPVIQLSARYINNPSEMLPAINTWFENEFTHDSYATVNSFFSRDNAYCDDQLIDPATNKPFHKPIKGQCKKSKLRYLNSVFCDLDVYSKGLTQGEAFGIVLNMMDSKRLPPVSWIKNSGRGLWLFWALVPTRSHYKYETDPLPTYERIQRQIRLILADLGSDPRATNANRISRIYGSRNHKSQTVVSLWQRTGPDGQVARYHLDELELFFGTYPKRHVWHLYESSTPNQPECDRPKEPPSPARQRLGVLGQTARWELELERFWRLIETVRSGRIKVGTRNTHVAILAAILKHVLTFRKLNAEQRSEVIATTAKRLWEAFEDQKTYELETVLSQLKSFLETQQQHTAQEQHLIRISQQTIADHLAITTDEAEQLSTLIQGTRKDRHWPPATGQRQIPKPISKAQQRQIRRDYIARFHKQHERPDYRTLAEMICQRTGLECSAPTARADWQAVFPPSRKPWTTQELPLGE